MMMKHERQTSRLEKSSNFFGGNNFSGLNLYGDMEMKKQLRQSKEIFTLIELLVVIGIITIMTSMLLPALNRARAFANQTSCVSKLKQIGFGFYSYANNYGDIIIPPYELNGSGNPVANPWPALIGDHMGFVKRTGSNASYIVPQKRLGTCPSDLTNNGLGWDNVYCWSYSMNYMAAFANINGVKINKIKKPSIKILLADGTTRSYFGNYTDTVGFRHSNKANFLFCDGHIKDGNFYYPREWYGNMGDFQGM